MHPVCRVCDEVFTCAAQELDNVVEEHWGCRMCNRAFERGGDMALHHHNMTSHKHRYCAFCRKMFESSQALAQVSRVIY